MSIVAAPVRHSSRAQQIERQRQPRDRLLGGGDFGRGHLREVFRLQHFAVGDGEPRVDLDLDSSSRSLRPPNSASWTRWAPGGGALGAVAACQEAWRRSASRCSRACARRCGRPGRTRSNARAASRTPRAASSRNPRGRRRARRRALPAHRARYRAHRNAGGAQRAREVEDIFRQAALGLTLGHDCYSAARSSAFASSSSAFTLLPSSRAMSS